MSRSHVLCKISIAQCSERTGNIFSKHPRNARTAFSKCRCVAFKNNPKTTSLQTSQSNILKWAKRGSPYEPFDIFENSKRARIPKFNFTTISSNKRTWTTSETLFEKYNCAEKMDVGTRVLPFGRNSTKRQFSSSLEIWRIQQTKLETVKSLRFETVPVDLSYWMLFEFWIFVMESLDCA